MKNPPQSLDEVKSKRKKLRNVLCEVNKSLSTLEKLALFITEHVGTMGFFLIILTWTVCWLGYNSICTTFPNIGLKAFDPFPAFVVYLLISNVIQILLMPLIMVGQNIQGKHSESRAEHDLEVNIKAEKEIEIVLTHLEYQNNLLLEQQQMLLQLVGNAKK